MSVQFCKTPWEQFPLGESSLTSLRMVGYDFLDHPTKSKIWARWLSGNWPILKESFIILPMCKEAWLIPNSYVSFCPVGRLPLVI